MFVYQIGSLCGTTSRVTLSVCCCVHGVFSDSIFFIIFSLLSSNAQFYRSSLTLRLYIDQRLNEVEGLVRAHEQKEQQNTEIAISKAVIFKGDFTQLSGISF